MNRPTLGQWCKIEKVARKEHEGSRTAWEAVEHVKTACEGMYVGCRTVFNGISHSSFSEGVYFEQTDSHEVWQFVTHERHNHIYAFPQDVKKTGVFRRSFKSED